MVGNLTCYIFNSHKFNSADSLMIVKATRLIFNVIDFNRTVSLVMVNLTIL